MDRFRVHSQTEDPEAADVVLFVSMGTSGDFAERVRAHPVYHRFPEKCFLFDSGDYLVPVVPGVLPRWKKRIIRPITPGPGST
jgi:hypothetical protein